MLTLDFGARLKGQRAIEHAGECHAVRPLAGPLEPDADLRGVVADCLPTMPPDAIAEMSLAQLHAVCRLAALASSDDSDDS